MNSLCRAFLVAVFALGACRAGNQAPQQPAAEAGLAPILASPDALDRHSFARPLDARVSHVALDLGIDFDRKRIGGTATLDIDRKPDSKQVLLDDKGLEIHSVTDAAGKKLNWNVGAADKDLGAPLAIELRPDTKRIVIRYDSAPEASALLWLTPEQTAGKKAPFVFSQGEAIDNRTWIPTQDSPAVRQTWEARIRVNKPLTVVMSAPRTAEPTDAGNQRVFSFRMDHSVAPYMIAIAAGDLAFKALGPRTGVWAEPATLPAAAAELSDTEKMVAAAEKLYGPYRWGRYDMLVLPPSYPLGGMENPTLTFLTPTFIAGDRSLNGLVAHELAHSWSGNLVTNANWADSWLNEGTTSYFENRIIEALYGNERAKQEAALSFADMEAAFAEVGANAPDTALHLSDSVAGPDAGQSGIIYDKGAVFLRTVEAIVGRQRFDAWLRRWFDNHAFQPATSAMILADMKVNLVGNDAALAERLQLDRWIYEPGLPENVVRPDPAAFAEVDEAARAYADTRVATTQPDASGIRLNTPERWANWTSAERQRFLAKVPREMAPQELRVLDERLGLSTTGNNEVLFLWLNLALANRYEPAVPLAEQFLATVGRRKFVSPLFETLMGEGAWGQAHAKRIYAKTRAGYHAVTRGTVDKIVLKTG